jgi:two-component system OmpR family response regulator
MPLAPEFRPDLILLDIMFPGGSGWDLCQKLRGDGTPIVFLSSRGAESDVVRGLQLGADDYVTKACRSQELIARIEAVLRRSRRNLPNGRITYQVGELSINESRMEVRRAGQMVHMTPTEFGLLLLLGQNLAGRCRSENCWPWCVGRTRWIT